MNFIPTSLKDAYLIEPKPFTDGRGWFMRSYCKEEFKQIGHTDEWVQMNHSFTQHRGAVRGMHFQHPPYAEIKLIRCVAGKVFDVLIDLRSDSPTFLQWFGIELSAENKRSVYVPKGMAHGFQVLEENAELVYCHSAPYRKEAEGAVRFDDPAIAIQWPLPVKMTSEKDLSYPWLETDFKGIVI